MPPEILALILEILVPRAPEIGETRPVSYGQLMADEPWYDYTRCRRGLRSACLVSRRLNEMATPLLYRLISIWDETGLLLLFRTLCNKPQRGTWTRYLSCHITLTRLTTIRDVRQDLDTYLNTFDPAPESDTLTAAAGNFVRMLARFLPHMIPREGDFDHVPQALLCFILMALPKLETLLMQVPISDEHKEYDVFCHQIKGIRELFSRELQSAPFQNIHTLLLQGDPELIAHFDHDECDCDIPEIFGAQPRRYAPLYASFPKLTTLEVSGDDGVWDNSLDEPDLPHHLGGIFNNSNSNPDAPAPPILANIKHVFLHDSVAHPSDLRQLLLNAPRLETLYMSSRRDDTLRDPGEDSGGHAHPEALDMALASHAKHLRNLDLSWEDLEGYESLIGAEGRLASLADMTQLHSLCVQMAVLYGKPAAVLEYPLLDLLPPNLVSLTLEDWWWPHCTPRRTAELDQPTKVAHYASQHNYRFSALKTLSQFARDVRTRLGRLKKVALVCRIPWTWTLEGAVPIELHFDSLKEVFLREGGI
ncbi:hypothetical protein N0V88_001533 [Collariella sp. IMI 366227]|nr:hypothetical protein N0V88_001533 [Collariella sp. IMI 366227]